MAPGVSHELPQSRGPGLELAGAAWRVNSLDVRLQNKPSDEMLTFEIRMVVYSPPEQEALIGYEAATFCELLWKRASG